MWENCMTEGLGQGHGSSSNPTGPRQGRTKTHREEGKYKCVSG
jgi:hypothetical protein